MNKKLVEYGIHNERSDLRAHVCVEAKKVYVYPTASGLAAIEKEKFPVGNAYQSVNGNKVKTGIGFLVPPRVIDGCRQVEVPDDWWWIQKFSPSDTTTLKGKKAVWIIGALMKQGRFPFPCKPEVIEDLDLQVNGLDIIVAMNTRVQVKCDYYGGPKKFGGTGNLFLQTHECNPLGKH